MIYLEFPLSDISIVAGGFFLTSPTHDIVLEPALVKGREGCILKKEDVYQYLVTQCIAKIYDTNFFDKAREPYLP